MYLFVFGRDQKLSKLELATVLQRRGVEFEKVYEADKYVVIDFDTSLDFPDLISRLGGTVRIAKIYHGDEVINESFIETMDFYFPKSFNYVIENFGLSESEINQVDGIVKKSMRQYKSKGVQKRPDRDIADPSNYYSWRLDEGFELFALKLQNKYFFAQSIACADPSIYEKKDNKRPVQKFTRGTSFRLAQMMVNCLGLETGRTIVDPFCGIGTFLIEGMLAGYNVVGIDNEQEMTEASRHNISWARKEFKLDQRAEVITQDSRIADFKADGCVFEPYMGPFMTKLPNHSAAVKVMQGLEKLYTQVFENLYKSLNDPGRIVCILPYFQTSEGKEVHLSKDFFNTIGFKLVPNTELSSLFSIENPIEYDTPDKARIRRRIYVFEKRRE